ncbi:uncharacterized protein [Elaeis guineensis]|uniref:uncharacterized protein isoform X2 n=1 Tax=Elaeis guineensis var. tenera TaxID=51953 RepID=UPI003C6D0375
MGRGKFKGKPTGRRNFSTPEEMIAGTSARPRTFKQEEAEDKEEGTEEEAEDDSGEETERRKGIEGIIQIENPNLVKPKIMKAKEVDLEKTTELSRRERTSSLNTTTKSRSCKKARRGKGCQGTEEGRSSQVIAPLLKKDACHHKNLLLESSEPSLFVKCNINQYALFDFQ